ncbi:hypothetical protein BpHYR1_025992 [Brachionus plicatilis]|uniref:Uncharacterized protein n=1 Tax=Brachionus plicatilis TaxID=10195 RepID=A0A3M7PFJ4_BRAPC|nr:hypothetical protein BpHYR1_025992 [Brachionus plicatilis]
MGKTNERLSKKCPKCNQISNESVSSTVVPDRLLVETSSPCFLSTQETIIEDIQENEFSTGIKDKIPDENTSSQVRTKSEALAIYLFWLETGMTQRIIKAHFRLNERVDVSRYCEQVRMSLLAKFVPDFLGPDVIERSEWVKQNTEIAKELYGLKDDNLQTVGLLIYYFVSY